MSNFGEGREAVIYCLCIDGDMYVGHTFNMDKRMKGHRTKCNAGIDGALLYTTIRECGGWDNVEINIVGVYDDCDLQDALEYEDNFFWEIKPSLNMCIPSGGSRSKNPFKKK